ncbi:flagellin B [Campylobacter sp. CLAX-7218-21]|uniref:flagellin B n=1 Tax=Campylobacter devanensis TaxID=3161138 RepID=UPI002EA5EEF3|nr:flagellin B [Campylobacter sp. CLAX-7218-21]
MSFRINTNIAAMNAHANSLINDRELTSSLGRLSSGLRIQTAADDASGLVIADSLKSQASSLGQAISNGNDAIGIIQTADKAMDEQIKILDTIKTKAIQAANDSQNSDSRKAIQNDISRLLDELDNIANTTSFNGQKLLNGNFTNKNFQISAYSNQTAKISVENTNSNAIGHTHYLSTTPMIFDNNKFDTANFTMQLNAVPSHLNGIKFDAISGQEILDNGLGVIADKINSYSSETGVKAKVKNEFISSVPILGSAFFPGSVSKLSINGVVIGTNLSVANRDPSNALIDTINAKSDITGVSASNAGGRLSMSSSNGKPILIQVGTTNDADALGLAMQDSTGAKSTSALILGELYLQSNNGSPPSLDLKETTGNIKGAGIDGLNPKAADTNDIIGSQLREQLSLSLSDLVRNKLDEHVLRAMGQVELLNPILELPAGVNSYAGAQALIDVSLNALKKLDKLRADLGSVQNQLVATINNITVTQVNVKSAESQIRDVDFASESANFSKFNILAQSGSYAMSQANAVQQNILRLLQ